MKKLTQLTLTLAMAFAMVAFLSTSSYAQETGDDGHGTGFVDANGDGYNDNAPDHDGDGIPNGQDPDYEGTFLGNGRGFVDEDGDGINDNAMDDDGDGIPNGQDEDFVRVQDGTGSQNQYGKTQDKGNLGSGNGSGLGSGQGEGTSSKGNSKKGGGKR